MSNKVWSKQVKERDIHKSFCRTSHTSAHTSVKFSSTVSCPRVPSPQTTNHGFPRADCIKWFHIRNLSILGFWYWGFLANSAGKESCNARDTLWIPRSGRPLGEGIGCPLQCSWASLVVQMVQNLPAMRETWIQSLGGEDPLEEGMATHSRILAWRIPMDRRAWRATVHGVAESDTTKQNTGTKPAPRGHRGKAASSFLNQLS